MKKLLSILIAIALLLSLSVTAFAEETTCDLQIADVQVTEANKDDITAAITAAGGTADGTATFDPDTNTLTLDNFSCSSDAFGGVINIQDGDITIKLKGNNTLSSTGEGTDGIYTNGNLAICNGEDGVAQGQLTINTVSSCIAAPSGTLEITDVKVTATSTESAGLFATSISLSGVTLSATAYLEPIYTDGEYLVDPETGFPVYDPETGRPVAVYGAINIENSTVEAYCTSGWNTYAFEPAPTISGTFTVTAGNDAASAVKVDAPTAETYTTSKYVKIESTEPETETQSTTVTYSVAPTYTVTIPATVALGETATIQAENVVVPKGMQVEVTLTNANGFTVATPQGAELGYTVKNGETTVNEGDTVLAVNPTSGKTGETTLTFTTPETVKFAGDYTGTVTFTIAVSPAEDTE